MEEDKKKASLINSSSNLEVKEVVPVKSGKAKVSGRQPLKTTNTPSKEVSSGPVAKTDESDFTAEIQKEQESKRKEIEKRKILWRKSAWKKKVVLDINCRLVEVKRVTKVTKGGRRFRFFAVALAGNGKGRVGFGTGKGNEVTIAKQKAFFQAEKNMISVPFVNGTIPHETIGKFCSSRIILKPAPQGTGILVGGAARTVVELLGITNICGKSLGSNNKMNLIQATLNGLQKLRTIDEVMKLRDLDTNFKINVKNDDKSKRI